MKQRLKRRTDPVNLGPAVNSSASDFDPFVAPDQSFVIFSSTRDGGSGGGDLHISFRTSDGGWSLADTLTPEIYTPDDLMEGRLPTGRVVLYDDDHFYMGGVLAELLAQAGAQVTLITPAAYVSDWTQNTLEQAAIHARLAEAGVEIVLNRGVTEVARDHGVSNCTYTGQTSETECEQLVCQCLRGSWGDWLQAGASRELTDGSPIARHRSQAEGHRFY